MKPIKRPDDAKIESIFHPSDFSEASHVAFAHALKIALVAKAELSILHVSPGAEVDWHDFPGVRQTLERWGMLPAHSTHKDVIMLGIDINKVISSGSNPVKACLGYINTHHTDLIVLAVHQHEGRMRWVGKSVGEPLTRQSGQMTLLISEGVDGFVSMKDGSVHLRHILIPIAAKPDPKPAIKAAVRLIANIGTPGGTVTLVHAGSESDQPSLTLPEDTGWTWKHIAREGDPVEVILQTASEVKAGLIVMTTDGPEGFLDGLRGTTSERVLRKATFPVAILPAGSMMG